MSGVGMGSVVGPQEPHFLLSMGSLQNSGVGASYLSSVDRVFV